MNTGPLLFTVALLTIISLYPFYLKKYKSHKYKGFWKYMGDINRTPGRAIHYPLAYLIAYLIVDLIYITYIQ
ncbi:hypothetical protein V7O66_10450 [Methanolobus sp. ZRKC3]|uniref:hypothetical protein n=1 Tax=Methanolobus sp. ZRKC3 TaxID=3125786 RepID=UPI00324CD0D0